MSDLSLDGKTIARVPVLRGNDPVVAPTDPRTMRPLTQMDVDTYRKGVQQAHAREIKKPGRKLGGVYISDKSENACSVKLCDSCITSYWYGRGGLSKQGTHKPSWNNYFTSTCDGCGIGHMLVILFLPHILFDEVLAGRHGRFASPKRPIFSKIFPSRAEKLNPRRTL